MGKEWAAAIEWAGSGCWTRRSGASAPRGRTTGKRLGIDDIDADGISCRRVGVWWANDDDTDLRQALAHPPRIPNPPHDVGAVQRDAVEEVQCGNVHAERRATEGPRADEVIEKGPHLGFAQPRRRSVMIRTPLSFRGKGGC
jgi:hypothetical protein